MIERYVPATPEVFQLLSVAAQFLDENRRAHGTDLVKSEFGFGGRAPGARKWRFTFFPANVPEKWEFELDEDEVRLLGEDDPDMYGTEIQVLAEPRRDTAAKAAPKKGAKGKLALAACDAPLGQRVLDRLVAKEAIELAPRARVEALVAVIERASVAAIDADGLDDDERGAQIAEAITAFAGVEELFIADDDLITLVRQLDGA